MPSVILAGTTTGTALSLTSDTSGELQIRTNNGSTTAMTLTTAGNVGIGITSPTTFGSGYVNAQIQGANGGALWVSDGASVGSANFLFSGIGLGIMGTFSNHPMAFRTNNTERMRIDSAGLVGIGTSSPVTNLQVGASSDVGIAMSNSSSVTSGNRGTISMFNSGTSTVGYIRFGAVTDNVGTDIQFGTRPAGGSVTERMRIASDGNVGIGTSSPVGKVQITGASSSRYLTLDAPDRGGYITFSAAGTAFADCGSQFGLTGSGSATNLFLTTRSTNNLIFGTADTERMRINSTGVITTPNQPAFLACRAPGSSAISSGTTVLYDVTSYNTGSMYNAATGRLTAPVSGVYAISYGMLAGPDATVYRLTLNLNGSNFNLGGVQDWNQLRLAQSGGVINLQGAKSSNVYLNAGDFINLVYSADNGVSATNISWFFFSGALLG